MEGKRKSIFGHDLTMRLICVFVGAVLAFLPMYLLYYQHSLNLLQEQVEASNEQIRANNAWQHYNGFRESIYEKWYYLCSDNAPGLCPYEWKFREISEDCDKIREALGAENWTESWELVEDGYGLLRELPGPLWVEQQ